MRARRMIDPPKLGHGRKGTEWGGALNTPEIRLPVVVVGRTVDLSQSPARRVQVESFKNATVKRPIVMTFVMDKDVHSIGVDVALALRMTSRRTGESDAAEVADSTSVRWAESSVMLHTPRTKDRLILVSMTQAERAKLSEVLVLAAGDLVE